eukprot:COSAG05_NODE_703_length_7857_cov_7.474091_3_plen_62_part_00
MALLGALQDLGYDIRDARYESYVVPELFDAGKCVRKCEDILANLREISRMVNEAKEEMTLK